MKKQLKGDRVVEGISKPVEAARWHDHHLYFALLNMAERLGGHTRTRLPFTDLGRVASSSEMHK
jgi:hypothetical protein